MGDINPATQREVLEFYQEEVVGAWPVGDYVRVKERESAAKACFGPLPDGPDLDWRVVEIDWTENQFLLAPMKTHDLDD